MEKFILLLIVCLMPFAVDAQVKSSKHSKKHGARKEKTVKKSSDQKQSEDIKVVELTVVEENPTPTYPRRYNSGSQKGTEDRTVTRALKEEVAVQPSQKPKEVKEETFRSVEQMPQFPGGEVALMKFLQSHINYPPTAAKNDIEGRVVVQFVVKKDGSIGEIKVVRSVDPELDAEAIRVCRSLPNFIPGRQNGMPVNVWYTIPVTFKLNRINQESSVPVQDSVCSGYDYAYDLLSKFITEAQNSLPMEMGNGLTMTSIDIVDDKVVYMFDNDESSLNAELLKGMRDHSTDTYGQHQLASYMLRAEDEISRGLIILIAMNEMGIQYYFRNKKQNNLSTLDIYPQTVKSYVEENF